MDEAVEFAKEILKKNNRINEYDFNKGIDKFDTSTIDYKEKITLDSLLETDYRSYQDYVNPRNPLMPLEFYRLAIENAKNLSKYEKNGEFDSLAYENSKEKEISDKLLKEYKNRQIARNINKKINKHVFNEISNVMIDTYAVEKIYTLIDQVYELSREKLNDSIECEFYLLSKQDENGHNIIKDIFFEAPQYNIQTRCEGLLKDETRKILDKKKIDYDILGWSHSHGNLGLFFSLSDDVVINISKHMSLLNPKINYENETFTIENKVPISIVFNRSKKNPPYRATIDKPRVVYNNNNNNNEILRIKEDKIDIANTYENNFSNKCISLNVIKDPENKKVDVNYIRDMVDKYIISYYKNPVKFALDTGRSPIRDKVYIGNKYKNIKREYEINPNTIFVDPVKKVRFDPKKFIEDYEKNIQKEEKEEENKNKPENKTIDVDFEIIDEKKQEVKNQKKLEDKLKDKTINNNNNNNKQNEINNENYKINDKNINSNLLSRIVSYTKNFFKKQKSEIKSKQNYQKQNYENLKYNKKNKTKNNFYNIFQKSKIKKPKKLFNTNNNNLEKKNKSSGNLSDLVKKFSKKIFSLEENNYKLNQECLFLQESYIKLLDEYQSLENKIKNNKIYYNNNNNNNNIKNNNYKQNYRTAIKDYHYKYSNHDSNLGLISKMLSGDYRGSIDNIKRGELTEKPKEKRLWKWTERFEALAEMHKKDKNYFKNMDTNAKNELLNIIKNNTYLTRKHKNIKKKILQMIET
ncbi:MAG: hypothetical protein ACLFPJ_02160 [Candidatus Woesearchaeota archaeon]